MFRLRFTTLVEAPLTVAFDVARELGHPWGVPLAEVESARPELDVRTGRVGDRGRVTHSRRFSATGVGTLLEERVDWETGSGVLRGLVDRLRVRRSLARDARAHLDGYSAAAAGRAREVVQVVGAAVVQDERVLVAQRSGGVYDGCWEFPGGKMERGESELEALVRECREELGVTIAPREFLGEVVLDGVVAGGAPGTSTMRVWAARLTEGLLVAHEHAELRWVGAEDLDGLDWIAADRPLLPAVRALLER